VGLRGAARGEMVRLVRALGEKGTDVKVTRRILIISFVSCVVLFVIAAPFGHDHHGVGLVLSDTSGRCF
jgi:hypothetical protein